MQPPATQALPVVSLLGVVVQFGGALMLIALFLTLRRFVLRRGYFTAWAAGWLAFAVAILALVVRLALVPGISGVSPSENDLVTRSLYLTYQVSKVLGFVCFVRGTLMYVVGATDGARATRPLWLVATVFAALSAAAAQHGLAEVVVWQTVVAVPAFAYCAWALFSLPRPRRTAGSATAGTAFALLAALWLAYAAGFTAVIRGTSGSIGSVAFWVTTFNSYLDLTLNLMLGYSMILLLMEDARREVDDAQAELRLTHDGLRRAALYDPLTDLLNRRAFSEGVGLEMARAAFGTVVIADLDNLKNVNDLHGHAAGDQLIRRCADALRTVLRSSDKLYRWGGDEFVLVLPSAHASSVLDRLRQAVETAKPAACGPTGELVWLEVSFGAADYTSFEEFSVAIERADHAMYREKGIRKAGSRTSGGIAQPSPTSMRAVR